MKKIIIALSLVGMLVGPIAGLTAKDPKLSSEQRHKKLKNIETEDFRMAVKTYIVGALTCGAFLMTANHISIAPGWQINIDDLVSTTFWGLATIGLSTAWSKIVKKRMKHHGEKDFWRFLLKDFKPQETKSQ